MARERIYQDNADKQRAYRERQKWNELETDSLDSYTSAVRLQELLVTAMVKRGNIVRPLLGREAEETLAKFVTWLQEHPEAFGAMLDVATCATGVAPNPLNSE